MRACVKLNLPDGLSVIQKYSTMSEDGEEKSSFDASNSNVLTGQCSGLLGMIIEDETIGSLRPVSFSIFKRAEICNDEDIFHLRLPEL